MTQLENRIEVEYFTNFPELNAVKSACIELTDYLTSLEWDEANAKEIINERSSFVFSLPYNN